MKLLHIKSLAVAHLHLTHQVMNTVQVKTATQIRTKKHETRNENDDYFLVSKDGKIWKRNQSNDPKNYVFHFVLSM